MKLPSTERDYGRRLIRGALAGTLATLPMSLLMLAAQKAGLMDKHPPEEITEAALEETTDESPGEPAENLLSTLNHFAFGAAAGALFGIIRHKQASPLLQGVAFALGVWTISYKGWVPALNILPPPKQDQRGLPGSMIAAHVVFGAVLGSLVQRFESD